MECKLFVLWLLPSLLFQISICVDQASFYGSSYISLPFQEAKSSTDLNFRFRTLLPNALILLVAGTTDYCIVRLENGRIKININLGAGESELFSQRNIKLNDFKWHEVSISRKEANLSMQIDNGQIVQKQLPGQFFELNIHYGLFVGGHGNFSEIFFGHLDNFRGCLSELSYNGVMVLEQARLRQLQSAVVQHITWNCASEFEASFEHPISFVEDDAFMLLSRNFHSKEIKIQFEIKTRIAQSILFFNMGRGTKLDFFLIEIWKSSIRLIIKSESKNTEVINNQQVADGHWHKIHVYISAKIIEISIDGKTKTEENNHGHSFQLNENIYIGGLEMSKRSRAMSKGCKFCDANFKGCIRHIILGDVKVSLSDVYVSDGLLPGCVWHYPCLQNPCKDDSVCVQKGLDSFQCQCQEEFCVKLNFTEGYKVFSHNSLATDLELLSVEPLKVLEGQSAIITTHNLYMILDYQKFGIKDSGINFYVVEGPMHGVIDVRPHEKHSFSLAEILKDKVHYIHDGSEHYQDVVVLELDFSPDKSFILPGYLQGRFKFSLSANIVPVNDLPQLTASESTVLRIVQGTKKMIDLELFKVKDPDSTPDQIIYNIIKSDVGHFEHRNKEGMKILSFTQKELEEKKIMFVHNSNSLINDSYISLQVSDGIETSPVTKIRVSVSPQYWRLENNTGLTVLHQTAAIITPYNLSFTSNVMGVDHRIQFHVVKKPSYGVIEVEKNMWESSEIFTNIDLKQHRVRYRHTTSKPDYDEFQFRLTLDKSSLYTFRLTFVKCSLLNANTKPILFLNDTWEITLSGNYLMFHTQPIKTVPTSIHYVITAPPLYGFLFSSMSKYKLRSCDMFTQEDIQSQNIRYRFHKKPFSYVNDSFQFVVLSPGCKNVSHTFNIIYNPSSDLSSKATFLSQPLAIDEGATGLIDLAHLNIKTSLVTDLLFNITQRPQNGVLQIKHTEIVRNDTYFFTLEELKSKRLYYQHDGSETRTDSFIFSALAANDENFQYVGKFQIEITLKNDNSPVRSIDKIFHVVVGSERVLTGNDLKYSDIDLDTTPTEIIYTCRETPNGNFYFLANRTVKIKEFTQSDVDNKRILFRHKGPEYGKVRLWVTDGKFHVNGVLEVQASAPFIHVHHKKLIVQQSSLAVITQENLFYSTNVFATDVDVIYEVTSSPVSGRLISTKDLKLLQNFTQEDINMGQVSYINEVSNSDADEIELTVRCKDAVNVAQLGVLILPSTYWEPLEIKNVNRLSVEESTSAIISKNILEISQLNVPPSAIYYHVNQPPENGYISVLTDSKRSDYEPNNVYYFTQDLINENRVLYIQNVANQTKDMIIFNVTNGMVWQNNIMLRIEIIPEQIYLGSNNLTVNEGGIVTLSTSHLFILTDYYKNKVQLQHLQYAILQDAQHGCIQIDKRCNKINKFSHKKLVGGSVAYAHDGSENLVDEIKITALINQKRSNPVSVNVNVLSVNDQKPKLINNTGLLMWEGGVEIITNNMLAASDDDRPGDTLKYQVGNCWWGSLSLKSDLTSSVTHFTQELIDKEMIVFQHQNGREAKFTFNISDGLHTTEEHTFYIKTKPIQLQLHRKSLHIFPLQRKYITMSHLLTTVSDSSRIVTYEITTPPSLGRLMMESEESSGIFKVVSSFTQNDLNNSRVFYEHTHQFSDLYANDSFVFNVKARLAKTLHDQILKIDISVSSGGLDAYVSIPKISVNEGGVTTVPLNLSRVVSFLENHAGIRSPIIHAAGSTPQHGQIYLQHNHNITTFTQQQLESGQVYYGHDHSDSLGDNIYFSLYLLPGYVILCNITVPIVVVPINDQPFNLVTPAPSLTVVQGENHTITRLELSTEDPDTPPSQIKYIIISGPSQGKLILLPNKFPTTYFTQADIDDKKLVYIHNSSILKDSFHFRVWDEMFRPQFHLFNIIVLPVNLNITPGLPVYLQQGSDVVFLSEKQFFVESNADKNKIQYTVKRKPKRGGLYVQDAPSSVFSQNDLKTDCVMYLQTDMTSANDTFKVIGEIISGNTSIGNEIEVVIKVQPLMQIGNFTVVVGEYNRITLAVLDATPLAKLTNSNPRYSIIDIPQCLQIRKVIRSSGEKRNVLNTVISSFTHDEIQSGLIYLFVKDMELPWNGREERLVFLLVPSSYQPAVGELKINIKSSIDNEIHSTLAGPSDPAGHEGGLHFASPNMTRDYFLIVSMVAGVIILGVAVIVVIKCRSLEAEELKKEEECLQPIPLPRPPDRLLASPSPLKQHLDGFPSSLPAALPQCKVTPLSRSELESHACYPYGVDEQQSDDWSSCEASDPTCPSKNIMLRRNQYWV